MKAYFNFKDEIKGNRIVPIDSSFSFFEKVNMKKFDARVYFSELNYVNKDKVSSVEIELYGVNGNYETLLYRKNSYAVTGEYCDVKDVEIPGDTVDGKYFAKFKMYSGGILLNDSDEKFKFEIVYDTATTHITFYNASEIEGRVELENYEDDTLEAVISFDKRNAQYFSYSYSISSQEYSVNPKTFSSIDEKIQIPVYWDSEGKMEFTITISDEYQNKDEKKYNLFKDGINDSFVKFISEFKILNFSNKNTKVEIPYVSRNVETAVPILLCEGNRLEPSSSYSEIFLEKEGVFALDNIFEAFPELSSYIIDHKKNNFSFVFGGEFKTDSINLVFDDSGPSVKFENDYSYVTKENEFSEYSFTMEEEHYDYFAGKTTIVTIGEEKIYTLLANSKEKLSYVSNGEDRVYFNRHGSEWYSLNFDKEKLWVIDSVVYDMKGSSVNADNIRKIHDYSLSKKHFVVLEKNSFSLNELKVINNSGGLLLNINSNDFIFDEFDDFFMCCFDMEDGKHSVDIFSGGYSFVEKINKYFCSFTQDGELFNFSKSFNLILLNSDSDLLIYPDKKNIKMSKSYSSFAFTDNDFSIYGSQDEIEVLHKLENYSYSYSNLCSKPKITCNGFEVDFDFELTKKTDDVYYGNIKFKPFDGYNSYEIVFSDKFGNESLSIVTSERKIFDRTVSIDFESSGLINDGYNGESAKVRSTIDNISIRFIIENEFENEKFKAKKAKLWSEKFSSESNVISEEDGNVFYFNIKGVGSDKVKFYISLDDLENIFSFEYCVFSEQYVLCEDSFYSGSSIYMLPVEVTEFSEVSFSGYDKSLFSVSHEDNYLKIDRLKNNNFIDELVFDIELYDHNGGLPIISKTIKGFFYDENMSFEAEIVGYDYKKDVIHTPIFDIDVKFDAWDLIEEMWCMNSKAIHVGLENFKIKDIINPNFDGYVNLEFKLKGLPFKIINRAFDEKIEFSEVPDSFVLNATNEIDGNVSFNITSSTATILNGVKLLCEGVEIFSDDNVHNFSIYPTYSKKIEFDFESYKTISALVADGFGREVKTNSCVIFSKSKQLNIPKLKNGYKFDIMNSLEFEDFLNVLECEKLNYKIYDVSGFETDEHSGVLRVEIEDLKGSVTYCIEVVDGIHIEYVEPIFKNANTKKFKYNCSISSVYDFKPVLKQYSNGQLYSIYNPSLYDGKEVIFDFEPSGEADSFEYEDIFCTYKLV